jgi:hypothetical protein
VRCDFLFMYQSSAFIMLYVWFSDFEQLIVRGRVNTVHSTRAATTVIYLLSLQSSTT